MGGLAIDFTPSTADASVIAISLDGDEIGRVAIDADSAELRVGVIVTDARCGVAESAAIVSRLQREAADRGVAAVEIATPDPLIRYCARRMGFGGTLRGALGGPVAPAPSLVAELGGMLPYAEVAAAPVRGVLRRLATAASSGNRDSLRVSVVVPSGPRVDLLVPDVVDLVTENLARAADTSLAVMARFRVDSREIPLIAFDESGHGLKHNKHAGVADPASRRIHLNANYASAEGVAELRRASRGVAMQVRPPYNSVDGTTAHEMWHLVEASFTSRRYRESLEFRRRLGEYFGVDTLEHVMHPGPRGDPEKTKAALRQLATEVSLYAATNVREATAEMFKAWWCAAGETTGVVELFGRLVGEFGLMAS